jgi:hypothetical protein
VFPHGVTSSEAWSPAIDRPFGKMPLGLDRRLEAKRSRGQRVLDGLSGARAGGRVQTTKAFDTSSVETGVWSIAAMIP